VDGLGLWLVEPPPDPLPWCGWQPVRTSASATAATGSTSLECCDREPSGRVAMVLGFPAGGGPHLWRLRLSRMCHRPDR